MNYTKWLLTVCLALSAGIAVLRADETPTTMPTTAPSTQPVAVNSKCPVTGNPVDPNVPTVQYDGKTIGFCCPDCVKTFESDPQKYAGNLK